VRRSISILVLVAAGTLVAGCTDGRGRGGTPAAGPTAAPATTAAPGGDPGGGAGGGRGDYGGGGLEPTSSRGSGSGDADAVRIAGFAFAPKAVAAKAGRRVRWEHQDAGVTHTVTADRGEFRSGELHRGDQFSHVFPTAGSFAYHCAIHPDMRGTVRVTG
jgi:plastocyanin